MANITPTIITVTDASSPNLLIRVLRALDDKIQTLAANISAVVAQVAQLAKTTPVQLRDSMQSTGATPLNITGLRGVAGDPQPASVLRYPAIPTGLPLQTIRDTQLILVAVGATYDMYTVIGGSPNTLVKLISGLGGGGGTFVNLQAATPGTVQTGHANLSGTIIAGAFSGPLTGNVTGNVTGTAATVTGAAQAAITSVGTLTGLGIAGQLLLTSPHLAGMTLGTAEELLILSNAAVATDTAASLIPSASLVLCVTTYVTTTISGVGVVSFSVGDPITATRFFLSSTVLNAGGGVTGLDQWNGSVTTDAAGPVNYSLSKVRITCNAIPAAGVVRIVVLYASFNPATS